jgi:hypothetical protein
MKLFSTIKQNIIQETHRIQLNNGDIIHHIEFLDEKGKVIDSITRTEDGIDIYDPLLQEKIEQFLNEQQG